MSDLVDIVLPAEVGEDVESLIVIWYKEPGDTFEENEVLVEVQTDKAVFEVTAEFDGTLQEIVVARGEVAAVGQVMARAYKGAGVVDKPQAATSESAVSGQTASSSSSSGETANKKVKATPLAKKLARENSVDLAKVKGSGVGGKISDKDVQAYIDSQVAGDESESNPDYQVVENDLIRKATAKHMYSSLQNSAQLTLSRFVDVTALKKERKNLMPSASWNDWILRASILALKEHPDMNAHWVSDEKRKVFNVVNIGLAVDTEKGLFVPVIHRADEMSFEEFVGETKAKVKKALNYRLTKKDLDGGTFAVTNLGGMDIQFFTPVLNPPQVGILGVGKMEYYMDMVENKLTKRWRLPLSITFDHRAIDGAPAARFLQTIDQLLTNFEKLV